MSYRQDPVYRTVQWLRTNGQSSQPGTFAAAFADSWGRWARVHPRDVKLRLGLANYKPFERARVMADVTFVPGRPGSSPITLNLFLHLFATPDAARREFEASTGKDLVCCYGPPVFHLEARCLVAWTLPNAPNLTELHELLNPETFRWLLSRAPGLAVEGPLPHGPKLVRYVPLKRAVLTWDNPASGERFYFKLIDGPAAAAAALNLRELHARSLHGELNFAVPRPLHYCPDLHTMIMSEVPGDPFTAIMCEGRPAPFAEVGSALAALHSLGTAPMTIWSPERELVDLRRHLTGAKHALPYLTGRLEALLEQLEQLPTVSIASYVPIHGNLFGDQILYDRTAAARRVGIVDWDAWSFGDPHFDLGRLIAHFLYLARIEQLPDANIETCIRALLQAYEGARGTTVDPRALEWHVAAALLLRAKISSLRKLRPGWPRHFDLMVTEAERILNREGLSQWKTWRVAKSTMSRELAAS